MRRAKAGRLPLLQHCIGIFTGSYQEGRHHGLGHGSVGQHVAGDGHSGIERGSHHGAIVGTGVQRRPTGDIHHQTLPPSRASIRDDDIIKRLLSRQPALEATPDTPGYQGLVANPWVAQAPSPRQQWLTYPPTATLAVAARLATVPVSGCTCSSERVMLSSPPGDR